MGPPRGAARTGALGRLELTAERWTAANEAYRRAEPCLDAQGGWSMSASGSSGEMLFIVPCTRRFTAGGKHSAGPGGKETKELGRPHRVPVERTCWHVKQGRRRTVDIGR